MVCDASILTIGMVNETANQQGETRQVIGYYEPGDGVNLNYYWDVNSTDNDDGVDATHPGLVITPCGHTGPGRWIGLVSGELNCKHYGAKGDNSQDDTAYIQRAVDVALYPDLWGHDFNVDQVRLPKGEYKTTKTLHLGYGKTSGFSHLAFNGEGGLAYTDGGSFIRPTFSDRPVINIQQSRGVTIDSIRIEGPTVFTNHKVEADWNNQLGNPSNNNWFVGIAVDAYSGTKPADPCYPDVDFPTGLSLGQWGKLQTSQVRIRNCMFRHLGAAVATKPSGGSGADQQADFVQLESCWIQNCKYGFAVNGSQTRQNAVKGCNISDCWAAVAGSVFGTKKAGNILISGGSNLDRCRFGIYVKDSASWANQITMRDTDTEGIGAVTNINGGGGIIGVNVEGCNFRFSSDEAGQPRYHFKANGCRLRIVGNTLRIHGTAKNRPCPIIASSIGNTLIEGNEIYYAWASSSDSVTAGRDFGWWVTHSPQGTPGTGTIYSGYGNRGNVTQRLANPTQGAFTNPHGTTYQGNGVWSVKWTDVSKDLAIGQYFDCYKTDDHYLFKVLTTDGVTGTILQVNQMADFDQAEAKKVIYFGWYSIFEVN